jgi:hypothetical protein
VLAWNPITAVARTLLKTAFKITTRAKMQYPLWRQILTWRQILRPHAIGPIGLSIAVVLWGFGYKISLYHLHAVSQERIPVAKLWIQSRDSSVVVMASRLKAKSHLVLDSQAVLSSINQRHPCLDCAAAVISPVCWSRHPYFDFLISLRSPPPLRLLLA